MTIPPDTKSWVWVLERQCPECGFDASTVAYGSIPGLVGANAAAWGAVLRRPDVAARPDELTWSPLEYAAHVRDVHRIFTIRLAQMLDEPDPLFANWDQDATAEAEHYREQDPAVVWRELSQAAVAVAAAFEGVGPDRRARIGRRSDGASFTVDSLARYFVHDPIHHLHDVAGEPSVER